MQHYALYLRKSRADLDAEARGEGETLARHRAALNQLANRRGLFISREYAELVSGDTIAARPQMQALLEDVRAGLYAGVIVNDIDRLGRGDSIDQEIIKLTFASTHTLIITPGKDIDPSNPSDEDMLDFSMFFARFEYRKISQRMAVGRHRSAASGNYIASRAPFGYVRVVEDGRYTLAPHPDNAPVVRMIFDWYASRQCGYTAIAKRLISMGVQSYSGPFTAATVRTMLANPVYIGQVVYGQTRLISYVEDGTRHKKRKYIPAPPTVAENAHPAIIPRETFDTVQQMLVSRKHSAPVKSGHDIINPLAGLLRCAVCGKMLTIALYTNRDPYLKCRRIGCPTRASKLASVEDAVLGSIRSFAADYSPVSAPDDTRPQRDALTKQADTLTARLSRARELLELGVYTIPEYMDQRADIDAKLAAVQAQLDSLAKPRPAPVPASIIERTLDAYAHAETPAEKNALLKSIVDHIDYSRPSRTDPFTITVYPVLGHHM